MDLTEGTSRLASLASLAKLNKAKTLFKRKHIETKFSVNPLLERRDNKGFLAALCERKISRNCKDESMSFGFAI